MNSQNSLPILGLSTPPVEIEISDSKNQIQVDQSASIDVFVAPLNGERKCCKCKSHLPENQFNRDRSKKSGLQSKCRRCSNACVESWRSNKRLLADERPSAHQPRAKVKKQKSKAFTKGADTQSVMKERALRDEGLTVRNRRHVPTQQRLRSQSMLHNSDYLEKLADKFLKDNQTRE
jgi:hypothetical protein